MPPRLPWLRTVLLDFRWQAKRASGGIVRDSDVQRRRAVPIAISEHDRKTESDVKTSFSKRLNSLAV